MLNEEFRNYIAEINPEAVFFDNPSFDNSIIGIDTNNAVVYEYSQMVEELMEDNDDLSYSDAEEFIEYNTIRTIPYIKEGTKPIIIYTLLNEVYNSRED